MELSLAEKGFSNIAQKTIVKFEQKQLSPRYAAYIKQMLEKWMSEVDSHFSKLTSWSTDNYKRKKRVISKALSQYVNCNPPNQRTSKTAAKELFLLPEEACNVMLAKTQPPAAVKPAISMETE